VIARQLRAPLVAFLLGTPIPHAVVLAQTCAAPPNHMIAWWTGDGTTVDIEGAYNGKLIGGATYGAGMVGQAFSLNGAGAYVQAPKSAAWGFGSKDFTIALWVNFNSVNSGPEGAACCSFTSTGPTSDRYF
jgi:hypothetical protein